VASFTWFQAGPWSTPKTPFGMREQWGLAHSAAAIRDAFSAMAAAALPRPRVVTLLG
jgi:hypothetical protein